MRISDWSSDVCSSDLDLRREPDALRFAARERAAGAIEVEIIEPDIVEEAEPFEDFLEDALGDLVLLRGEIGGERLKEGERIDHRETGDAGDVAHRDLDRERLGLEAGAVADLAGLRGLVFAQFLAHPRRFGLPQAAVEVADHALR